MRAVSLFSFFFSGCLPRFSCLGASPLNASARALPLLNLKKRETARSLMIGSLLLIAVSQLPFIYGQAVYGGLGKKPDKNLIDSYEHFALGNSENLKMTQMLRVTISR